MCEVPLLARILTATTLGQTDSSSARLESEAGLAGGPDQLIVLVNPLGGFLTLTEDQSVRLLGGGDTQIVPQYLPVSPVEPVLVKVNILR